MDRDQEIIELKAQLEAMKQVVIGQRKVFINLLVVIKEAGATINAMSSGVLGMEHDLEELKKRHHFGAAAEAAGG